MKKNSFQILVLSNGTQLKQCLVIPNTYSKIGIITSIFPSISELLWFKSEVIKAKEKGGRLYTGLNTFVCFVTGDICELGHQDDKGNFDKIPTQVVLDFIDEAIVFHKFYESGGIPGIIPESKKDEWVIVPKEFVKDEYWLTIKNEEKEE